MNSRFDFSFIDPSMYANVFLKWARYDAEKLEKTNLMRCIFLLCLCAVGIVVVGVLALSLLGTGWELLLLFLFLGLSALLILYVVDLRRLVHHAKEKKEALTSFN